LFRKDESGYVHRSFDLLKALEDVLGKKVSQIPENYEMGELVVESTMDLETNTTKG